MEHTYEQCIGCGRLFEFPTELHDFYGHRCDANDLGDVEETVDSEV